MAPARATVGADFFYRGHTPVSTLTPWQSFMFWLPPPGKSTALSASELNGTYCYLMVDDVTPAGIYETEWHRELKSKGPTKAQCHNIGKWPKSPSVS